MPNSHIIIPASYHQHISSHHPGTEQPKQSFLRRRRWCRCSTQRLSAGCYSFLLVLQFFCGRPQRQNCDCKPSSADGLAGCCLPVGVTGGQLGCAAAVVASHFPHYFLSRGCWAEEPNLSFAYIISMCRRQRRRAAALLWRGGSMRWRHSSGAQQRQLGGCDRYHAPP